jgi:adenosine deaminase
VNSAVQHQAPLQARVELHCHLDGSVRPSTVADLAQASGLSLVRPVLDLVTAPADVGSLRAFLPYLDLPITVLQTPDSLRRAARELVEDWQSDLVGYGEVRFAPQLHDRLGMTLDEAVSAVAAGLHEGAVTTGVRTGLILCCLRHQSPDVSMAVAEAAVRHPAVIGLDLAGDERIGGSAHREAFDLAHSASLAVTIHAGEAAGPRSVWEAIDDLGAQRIGHGVRAATDASLVRRLVRDRIALETCPACNVITQAVPDIGQHPADDLLRRGVRVTISTDTRTTASTTLDHEYSLMQAAFGWGPEEVRQTQSNARDAAFAH